MNTYVCLNGNNPYINNPNATEIFPRSQVTHEGRLFTKQSYQVSNQVLNEVKIGILRRLIIIIQVVALVILSCSIALAFRSVRNLLLKGLKGLELKRSIVQRDAHVLMPHHDFFERSELLTGVGMVLASNLNVKDLLAIRGTSVHLRILAETTLTDWLNAGAINPVNIGISTVQGLIDFFGEHCSKITRLNLQSFPIVNDEDIEKLSQSFPKLSQLFLDNAKITNECESSFKQMLSLKNLHLSHCQQINDVSFLASLTKLTNLSLDNCRQITNVSFLASIPRLTSLSLAGCEQINDVSFLTNCPGLTSLDLSFCSQIHDFNSLASIPRLTSLELSSCLKIRDFSFLTRCPGLTSLTIDFTALSIFGPYFGFDFQNDINFRTLRNRGVEVIDRLRPI